MSNIDKQALTAESARKSENILLIVATRLARRELFTPLHYVSELPQKVVSMRVFREALERSEETLQREVCKIVDGHDRMQKKLKEAEEKLEAAEKRIAQLERSETQLIEERDNAESALNDAYKAVMGQAPEWSNWFSFADAIDEIELACGLWRNQTDDVIQFRARIAELEAREVTLPAQKYCPAEYAGSVLWGETEVWNQAISECAKAISAAGIGKGE